MILRSFILGAMLACGASAALASPPTSGLIGYWQGNGNADDSSPTANNGNFSGSYASGPFAGTRAFDLSTGGVTIPNNAAYGNFDAGFSAGFWFNFNGHDPSAAWDVIGQDVGPGSTSKWVIFWNYTVGGAFELHLNGSSFAFLPASQVTIARGWNQLTITKGGGDYEFYLDKNNIGSLTFPGTFPAPAAPLQFGFSDGGSAFPGLLADVALYDRALTPTEVTQLASGAPEPATWAMMLVGLGGLGGIMRLRRLSIVRQRATT